MKKSDSSNTQSLIKYRFERSNTSLREADLLFSEGFYNAAINRLYYACYYAISALLFQKGIIAQTHSGTKSMFSLHIVATGEISEDIASTYYTLFGKRQSGDYDDYIVFTQESTKELMEQAIVFVEEIGKLL